MKIFLVIVLVIVTKISLTATTEYDLCKIFIESHRWPVYQKA